MMTCAKTAVAWSKGAVCSNTDERLSDLRQRRQAWVQTNAGACFPWKAAGFLQTLLPDPPPSTRAILEKDPRRWTAEAAIAFYGPDAPVPDEVLACVEELFRSGELNNESLMRTELENLTERMIPGADRSLVLRALENLVVLGSDPAWPSPWSSPWPTAREALEKMVEVRAQRWVDWIVACIEGVPDRKHGALFDNVRRFVEALLGREPDFDDVARRLFVARKMAISHEIASKTQQCEEYYRARLLTSWNRRDSLGRFLDFALGTKDLPGKLYEFQKGIVAMVYASVDDRRRLIMGPVLLDERREVDPYTNFVVGTYKLARVQETTFRRVWLEGQRMEMTCNRCKQYGFLYFGDKCPHCREVHQRTRGERPTHVHVPTELVGLGGLGDLPDSSLDSLVDVESVEAFLDNLKAHLDEIQRLADLIFLEEKPVPEALVQLYPSAHWPDRHEHLRELYCALADTQVDAKAPLAEWKKAFAGWLGKTLSMWKTFDVAVDCLLCGLTQEEWGRLMAFDEAPELDAVEPGENPLLNRLKDLLGDLGGLAWRRNLLAFAIRLLRLAKVVWKRRARWMEEYR